MFHLHLKFIKMFVFYFDLLMLFGKIQMLLNIYNFLNYHKCNYFMSMKIFLRCLYMQVIHLFLIKHHLLMMGIFKLNHKFIH